MMEAIFILLALSLAILYIGFYKKDSTIIYFASFLILLISFDGIRNGFGEFSLSIPFGILILFFSLYIMLRTSIEMITGNEKNGTKKSKHTTN